MSTHELNLEGLVGPTHHYAGLSWGNTASTSNAHQLSNPRAAALQGLHKMKQLHALGIQQAVLPPHQRPDLSLLKTLGFSGSLEQQLTSAQTHAPDLLSACYSASSMWAANAATVSSSQDTKNGLVHFTAANLMTNLHRSNEAQFSKQLLAKIFSDESTFEHHNVLPQTLKFGDEGAANHNRFCSSHDKPGLNLFVYGEPHKDAVFPSRQSRLASEAIARSHGLYQSKVLFACQNPVAIDAGVFHNDVISVANESLFLVHEDAFLNQKKILTELKNKADFDLKIVEVPRTALTLKDAVQTYLFNAQLITLPNNSMALIAPEECKHNLHSHALIQTWLSDLSNPIKQVYYLDVKQSMRNGGGPACLRLRVPLNTHELNAMHQGVVVTPLLLNKLEEWILNHYRTELSFKALADPQLIDESNNALDELTKILGLGSIYPFQRE